MSLKLGCNAGIFPAANSAVPGLLGVRSYRDTVNDIPTVWPGVPGATNTTVSLRPDLDALLGNTPVPDNGSGFTTLAGQITYLAQQAPVLSKLTIWHEAGNLYQDNPAITPQKIRSSHVVCHTACAGTNVDYGCIIYGDIVNMTQWIPGANGSYPMDWYGIDVYDNTASNNGSSFRNTDGSISQSKVNAYLTQYRTLAQARSGITWPQIDICECNASLAREQYRGPFFKALASWLNSNGGRRLQVFYKTGGVDGGDWLPDDAATIAALNFIATTYA